VINSYFTERQRQMTDYFPYESVSKLDSKIMPNEALPSDQYLGVLEPVAHFNEAMPTGVTVSHKGRIFVNFPRWGDKVSFAVAEVKEGKAIAYPDEPMNQSTRSDITADDADALVSAQSVVVDPADRLWILDTGSPMFQPTKYGGPKLVCMDLKQISWLRKFSSLKTLLCLQPI
jgi:hypothetical protein